MSYLTTAEAAAYARRHPETIREAARKGELRCVQRVERGPRQYRSQWLDDWMDGVRPRRLAALRNTA